MAGSLTNYFAQMQMANNDYQNAMTMQTIGGGFGGAMTGLMVGDASTWGALAGFGLGAFAGSQGLGGAVGGAALGSMFGGAFGGQGGAIFGAGAGALLGYGLSNSFGQQPSYGG